MSARFFLVALVAFAAVSTAYGQLALCKNGAAPAVATQIKVTKNAFNPSNKKAEVVISFVNPTNSNTGCPTSYTIDLVNSKGTAVGSKRSMSSPIASPVLTTFYLNPGEKYTIKSVALETKDGKKSISTANLAVTGAFAGITPLRKML